MQIRCPDCGRRRNADHSKCRKDAFGPPSPPASGDGGHETVVLETVPGYQLEKRLGQGGFAEVFAATRLQDGIRLALKLSRQDIPGGPTLLREAEVLKAMGGDIAPKLYDAAQLPNGRQYYAMALVSGKTLAAELEEHASGIPAALLPQIVRPLLRGIEAIHTRGYIHSDLKPDNIFLRKDSQGKESQAVTLIDFGVSQTFEEAAKRGEGPNQVAGTAEYMSPEQCSGKEALDRTSDVYASGVIVYELIAGRPPFFGLDADVHKAHQNTRPPPISTWTPVSVAVEETVLQALAKDPARRFPTVAAFLSALEDAWASASTAMADITGAARPAAPSPAAKAAADKAKPERLSVAILCFQTTSDAASLQATIKTVGGQLAHVDTSGKTAAVFESGNMHAVRRALRAAHALVEGRMVDRVLIHTASVTVQARVGQPKKFLSTLFAKAESYPLDTDPKGVLMTAAAHDAVPSVEVQPVKDRPGILRSAQDVDSKIEQITASQVARTPLMGRDAEVAQLLEHARHTAQNNTPGIDSIVAGPGLGKSHLGATLVDRLKSLPERPQILQIRASEPLDGDTDSTLRILLRRALDLPEAAPDDGGQALLTLQLGSDLGPEAWAAVAIAMGWVSTDHPDVRHLAAAPGVLRSTSARVLGQAMRKMAQVKPMFFVLDDAHYADEATLDALEYATLQEAQVPLWICVLARESFLAARPMWGLRAGSQHRLTLANLDTENAIALCRLLLRPVEAVPAEVVRRLVDRTEGNPMLLTELVRGLHRDGLIRAAGKMWILATDELDKLPDTPLVQWLGDREIKQLPPDLLAHGQLAALLGLEFTRNELEGVLRQVERQGGGAAFPLDADVGLRRLTSSGVLVARRQGRLGFRNSLLQQAIDASVSKDLRQLVHMAAYTFYRDGFQGSPDEQMPRVAFHASKSNLRGEAAHIYFELAERARARHAYLQAENMYSRSLSFLPEEERPKLYGIHRGRGVMRYRLGRHQDSLADFGLARTLAKEFAGPIAEAEVLLDQATTLDWMTQFHSSKELLEQAEAIAPKVRPPLLEAGITMATGRSLWRFSEWEKASEYLKKSAEQADAIGDDAYEILIVSVLVRASILAFLQKFEEALAHYDRAIGLSKERNDQIHMGSAVMNRLMYWVGQNNAQRAMDDTRTFMQIGREAGILDIEYTGHMNLGDLAFQTGDTELAYSHSLKSIEVARRLADDSDPRLSAPMMLKARIEVFKNQIDQARKSYLHLMASVKTRVDKGAQGLIPSDEVLARMVDLSTREATDEEWDELEKFSAQYGVQQDPIEVVEIRALTALRHGRKDDAKKILDRAMELSTRMPNLMGPRLKQHLQHFQ